MSQELSDEDLQMVAQCGSSPLERAVAIAILARRHDRVEDVEKIARRDRS